MEAYSESSLSGRRLLKAKLQSLADIPIPSSLEQRLLDTIPYAGPQTSSGRRFFLRRWRLAAAAAIMLPAGIVCVQNYGLLPFSQAEPNVAGQSYASLADQNSPGVADTNDANSPR